MSQSVPESPSAAAGIYRDFLKGQLAEQDARKASFEQRGLSVVTTAGTLATLLFGLAAFATAEKIHPLTHDAKVSLIAALVAFGVAGILALLTNLPIQYDVPKSDSIKRLAEKEPPDSELVALRNLTEVYSRMATDAKRKNGVKGWLLFLALLGEVVAVLAVVAAVAIVVG
jgi:hypothetical protein